MCLNLLVEGNSILSTGCITGVHRDTYIGSSQTVGEKCIRLQENLMKGINVDNVEAHRWLGFQRN
jgi:hypothetical protein